jgi:proton glutamate symport protein
MQDGEHLRAAAPAGSSGRRTSLFSWRRFGLAGWIVVAMIAGTIMGLAWPHAAIRMAPLETIFLRLIRSVVGPLIFATLVAGIAAHRDLKQVGRIALKALIFFEAVTTLALFAGVWAAQVSRPGTPPSAAQVSGANPAGGRRARPVGAAGIEPAGIPKSGLLDNLLLHAVPQSFAEALADGETLQVVVFSVLFGLALALTPERVGSPLLAVIEALAQVMFRLTNLVMWVAPLGVFGALASAIGAHGLGVLLPLGRLVAALYVTLAIFILVVFGGLVVLARIPARRFIAAVREPVLIAFSTASSEAALPAALENVEALGVPVRICGFVIPTGYSFNLVGSTLYLALAAMFLAQSAGQSLGFARQLAIVGTLALTSKGVAGVARAAIVILAASAGTLGLPLAGIGLLLAVDQFMDMGRSGVNVLGNCLAAAVVTRWEGVRLT